jgi:hypothetical protein
MASVRLRGKIARQKVAIEKLVGIKKKFKPVLSTGGRQLLKHLEAQRRLDLKWLQGLHSEVAAGRVRDVPNVARLQASGWRLPNR